MKKLYTFIVAGAVICSVGASTVAAETMLPQRADAVRTEKKSTVADFPAKVELAPVNKSIRSLRKADGVRSLEGVWSVNIGDFYDLNDGRVPSQEVLPVAYNATMEGSVVTFTPYDEEGDFYEFKARYNEENLTLTLEKTQLFVWNGFYIFQQPFKYDETKKPPVINVASFDGSYDPDAGTISFPINHGISYDGYTNMSGSGDAKGAIILYDLVAAYQFDPSASLEGNWEMIGNATFHDGWIIPAMGPSFANQNDYDVQFEQNTDIPTRFRLVNPYLSGPAAKYNGFEGTGYIVFDIADHQHVMFYPCDAGFINYAIGGEALGNKGITTLYCYNALGYEAVNQPALSMAELLAIYNYIPFTVYEDNTVKLGKISNNGETAYDANFGYQDMPFGGLFWGGVNMEASIKFPTWFNAEVGRVAVDEEADAQYYNLNGVRLSNPAKGEIVIKRAGGKVTKEIIK